MIQIRMSETGVQKLDSLAESYHLTRADVIRACLTIAFRNQGQLVDLLRGREEEL